MSEKRPKKAPKSPKICAMCTNTPKPSTGRILGYVPLGSKHLQATSKQALLLSVFAIARPHRSGVYATLAILEPRWCPCQIQLLSQKLTGGAPVWGRQVGRCPPKRAHFVRQKQSFFSAKWPPDQGKMPKQSETVDTLHVRLDFTVSKSPLVPFNTKVCLRNGPKRRQKAQNLRNAHQHPETKHGPYLGLRASKSDSKGTYSPRNPPLFVVPKPKNRPTSHLDPRTSGHLVEPDAGQRWVHEGPRGEKIFFSKVVPGPLGMLKQVFLAHFELVVTRFGPWKIPKCLENGPFWDQKWVKNGSKMRFPTSGTGPFWMLKQVFLAHFEPVVTCFGPWKIPKCLENGPFWDQKWVPNG